MPKIKRKPGRPRVHTEPLTLSVTMEAAAWKRAAAAAVAAGMSRSAWIAQACARQADFKAQKDCE